MPVLTDKTTPILASGSKDRTVRLWRIPVVRTAPHRTAFRCSAHTLRTTVHRTRSQRLSLSLSLCLSRVRACISNRAPRSALLRPALFRIASLHSTWFRSTWRGRTAR